MGFKLACICEQLLKLLLCIHQAASKLEYWERASVENPRREVQSAEDCISSKTSAFRRLIKRFEYALMHFLPGSDACRGRPSQHEQRR